MAEWKLADAENIRANLTKAQEDEISMMYREVYLSTRKQMLAIPKDGTTSQKIQKQYLDKLHKQLDEAYKSLGIGLEKQIKKGAKKAAEGVVEDAKRFAKDLGLEVEGAYSMVPRDIINSIVTGQVYGGDWSLSGAIWSDINKHQSDISKVIAEGVAANKSAYDIAKDLEKYVDPKAKKEWDWSKVYPGTSKKVDYNAQRLARTMVSHAYQQSLERVCKNNPFVDGFIWQSAHSDRICPICAERDGQFFKKGDLPLDHPNGMCTFIASIEGNMTDVANRLGDWVQGKDDPALDQWAKDLGGKLAQQKAFSKNVASSNQGRNASFNSELDVRKKALQDEIKELKEKKRKLSWASKEYADLTDRVKKKEKDLRALEKQAMRPQNGKKVSTLKEAKSMSRKGYIPKALKVSKGDAIEALEAYIAPEGFEMNKLLRGIKIDDSMDPKQIKSYTDNLSSYIGSQALDRPQTVYRGTSKEVLFNSMGVKNPSRMVGGVYTETSFASTSPDFDTALSYSDGAILHISLPEGAKAVQVNKLLPYADSKEVTIANGSQYRVTKAETAPDGMLHVYMDYLK